MWVLNPQTTDQQSGMLTIIPNEQAVGERHRKPSTTLQSWLTDSNWIQLIQLNLVENRKNAIVFFGSLSVLVVSKNMTDW